LTRTARLSISARASDQEIPNRRLMTAARVWLRSDVPTTKG